MKSLHVPGAGPGAAYRTAGIESSPRQQVAVWDSDEESEEEENAH